VQCENTTVVETPLNAAKQTRPQNVYNPVTFNRGCPVRARGNIIDDTDKSASVFLWCASQSKFWVDSYPAVCTCALGSLMLSDKTHRQNDGLLRGVLCNVRISCCCGCCCLPLSLRSLSVCLSVTL